MHRRELPVRTYVKIVNDLLYCFLVRSRRSREGENSKVLISTHHVPHDTAVCVVATGTMSLIDDETCHVTWIQAAFRQVVLNRLWRAVDDALRGPADCTEFGRC